MPPPNPSTDLVKDPRVRAEVTQLTRALRAEGPADRDELARRVGATYWDEGRFDGALQAGIRDGFLVRGADGRLATP